MGGGGGGGAEGARCIGMPKPCCVLGGSGTGLMLGGGGKPTPNALEARGKPALGGGGGGGVGRTDGVGGGGGGVCMGAVSPMSVALFLGMEVGEAAACCAAA